MDPGASDPMTDFHEPESMKSGIYPLIEIELGILNTAYEDDEDPNIPPNDPTIHESVANPVIPSPLLKTSVQENSTRGGDRPGTWDNPLEFLLSCIAMSVGLGNVWRFPFTAYENGGGAYLIPYFIVLILIGRPIYYLEMCLGQFSSYGQVKVWGLSPFFKGVGYSSALGATCTMTFYCSIIALTIYYLFLSFQNPLPWTVCDSSWGDQYCDITNGSYVGPKNISLSQLYHT